MTKTEGLQSKKKTKLLQTLWSNVKEPQAYTGRARIYRAAKAPDSTMTRKTFNDWLTKQRTYTLHKPARQTYKTSRVVVHAIDELWQVDLVDLSKLARYNKGNRYVLTCIDVLSKYAWMEPVKRKTGPELAKALTRILNGKRKPVYIQSDKGTEFYNAHVKNMLKRLGIRLFSTYSERKASVVERFNRTMKSRMWKYFTDRNTRTYIDILPDLVRGYNSSYHRTIGCAPIEVTPENFPEVWARVYENLHSTVSRTYKYEVGDHVRISKARRIFDKGYLPNWTEEIFVVRSRLEARHPVKYELSDSSGEPIKGTFYEEELQRVALPDTYQIERIVRRRKRGNTKYFLVKWLGYPESFNSWISEYDFDHSREQHE